MDNIPNQLTSSAKLLNKVSSVYGRLSIYRYRPSTLDAQSCRRRERSCDSLSSQAVKEGRNNYMAIIAIPDSIQAYFPNTVEPSQLWVNYSPKADSLTIYFTGQPVPSVWDDIDQYAYIGFALDDETSVTGIMIEHFSKWLFVYNRSKSKIKPAYKAIGQKIAA